MASLMSSAICTESRAINSGLLFLNMILSMADNRFHLRAYLSAPFVTGVGFSCWWGGGTGAGVSIGRGEEEGTPCFDSMGSSSRFKFASEVDLRRISLKERGKLRGGETLR